MKSKWAGWGAVLLLGLPLGAQVERPAAAPQSAVEEYESESARTDDWVVEFLGNNPAIAREMMASPDAPAAVRARESSDSSDGQSRRADYERLGKDAKLRAEAAAWLQERGYGPEKKGKEEDGGKPEAARQGQPEAAKKRPYGDANDRGIRYNATPYPKLQAMRDLYAQVAAEKEPLERFGMQAFAAGALQNSNFDLPAGPDYVLGPGDRVTVDIWGGVSQRLERMVDREGRVALPEAGTVVVGGHTLAEARALVERALAPQFRNAKVDLGLARVRSVRVYVVGEVRQPGAYDVSSLSTAMNALYAAGGPTERGSLRRVEHARGRELVRALDLYDLLLRGVRADVERLQAGDTIRVAPVGTQVAVEGMVRRPAVYEMRDESNLQQVVELAGGLLPAAQLGEITVERIVAHAQRVTVSVRLPENADSAAVGEALASFAVQDGDRVRIAPILPYSEQTVYLEGHVTRPGKYPYRAGMEIGELLRSYKDLLPEAAARAEIVRLQPPDYRPVTLEVNLDEVMEKSDVVELKPFDTVRVYGRYQIDAPRVSVSGEVLRPGEYPLSKGMKAGDLLRAAGGFRRSAYRAEAELGSYAVVEGKTVLLQRRTVALERAAEGDGGADVELKPGDVLAVRKLSGWDDIGSSVKLEGEVVHPGSYAIREGERLSSVLRRAGGLRREAYPAGAALERPEVKVLAEKSRAEMIRQVELQGTKANFAAGDGGQERAALMAAMLQQQQQVLARLSTQPVSGRMVIRIEGKITEWENTPADVEMRAGDVLTVPKRPEFVLVSGQVYNASALAYTPGKSAGWYLARAGGATEMANKGAIFVVRANGSVVSGQSGWWFSGGVLSTRLNPGDTVVVPEKALGGSAAWKNIMTVAQFATAAAVSVGVALR